MRESCKYVEDKLGVKVMIIIVLYLRTNLLVEWYDILVLDFRILYGL